MKTFPNWVDLVVVTFVFLGCYNGFHRGLLTGLLRLVGSVSVTVLTINYADWVTDFVQPWVGMNPVMIRCLMFWALLFVSLFLVRRLIHAIAQVVKWERIHWLTQSLACAIGTLQGLWWAGIILVALSSSGFLYLQDSVEQHSLFGARYLTASRDTIERVANYFPGTDHRGPTLIPPLRVR